MEKYIKAIEENVCSICVDSSHDGKCNLNEKEICAVRFFLPKIVELVRATDSEAIEVYKNKLRETVCKECRAQNESGNCYLRDDSNCSLDRYFSIIVETIQKVDKKKN